MAEKHRRNWRNGQMSSSSSSPCLPTYPPTYIPTYLHTYIPTCLRAVYACAFVFLPTSRDRSGFPSLAFSLVYVLLLLLCCCCPWFWALEHSRLRSAGFFFPLLLLLLLLPSMVGLCSFGALIAHIFEESFVVAFVLAL